MHVHPAQDEFTSSRTARSISNSTACGRKRRLGTWCACRAFRTAISTSRTSRCALFWASLARMLEQLFDNLHKVPDPGTRFVKISGRREVEFLPPEANA